ncbi:hypothetical protein [Arthrobacter sp. 18067]|uniref:hypothetical protein n=1 Tax=Arthrobacter sp. 18067 TaxID=2681413 RepID=UPI001358885E|nr:hypothetical protein [Arthrobacter sp. 18067]
MQVKFKGLNLGDDTGIYFIQSIDGWEDRPDIVNGSAPRSRRNGSMIGGLLASKRVITMDLDIASDPANGHTTTMPKRQLRKAMVIDDEEHELYVDLGYGIEPEIAFVRVTNFDMPTMPGNVQLAHATIEFVATDPRRYSPSLHTVSSGLQTRAPAVAYPITYPAQYSTALTNPGEAQAINTGTDPSSPVFTINGPVSQPSITLVDGEGVRTTRFNLSIGLGEALTVDTNEGSVRLNATPLNGADRGALIEELTLRPGLTTVRFRGSGNSNASLVTQWRDATM